MAREKNVTAPVDGIVTSVNAQEGQSAQMDQAVLTLCPYENFELSVLVDEMDLDKIALGARVYVVFDAFAGEMLEGTVKSLSASVHARLRARNLRCASPCPRMRACYWACPLRPILWRISAWISRK